MNEGLSFVLLGIFTGVMAGFFGVGGGIVMVPALIIFFHFTQHQAQGISIASMLLPVGIFGAFAYYKAHPFPIKPTLWIALGILLGVYFGSTLAQHVSPKNLKNGFAIMMIAVALKMLFGK